MLMDTGLQAQGMAVALTRFRFQRRQQLFSQLLAAVLGIDIHPLHLAKAFLTEDNSPAANGLALRAADRQGDDRLRRLLAQELEIGAQSIDAFILGEHGDTQFPVWSHSSVYGTPIADLYQQRTGLPLDREAMADKVRKLGFEIYAGKGCTEYGVAGTIAEICRNIFTGSHRALAVSCILDGEYGVSGAAAGVPAVLAQGGVKQIIELQLAGEEQAKFSQSIEVIKANIARLP